MIASLSLRARLTLWYTLRSSACLAAFGAVVVWQQGRIGMRRVDRQLAALTATLENVLRDEITETADPAAAAAEAQRTVAAPNRSIAIFDGAGAVAGG